MLLIQASLAVITLLEFNQPKSSCTRVPPAAGSFRLRTAVSARAVGAEYLLTYISYICKTKVHPCVNETATWLIVGPPLFCV